MLLLTSTFAYLWMAFHNNRIFGTPFWPSTQSQGTSQTQSCTVRSHPHITDGAQINLCLWSDLNCMLASASSDGGQLALFEITSVNFPRSFALHLLSCSHFPAKAGSAGTQRVLPCLCWGFTPAGCLACCLFNPHMKLNCPCKENTQWWDEWRLQHPSAEQDVSCLEQSDRPNQAICSSVKTAYSAMLTVSSALDDKNPDFFLNFHHPFRTEKMRFSWWVNEPVSSDIITLNSVSDVFKISLLKQVWPLRKRGCRTSFYSETGSSPNISSEW